MRIEKGNMKRLFKHRLYMLFAVALICLFLGGTGAQAANVVSSAKKNTVSGGTFVKTQKGIRYRKAGGTYLKNTWAQIGGKIYHFQKNSYVSCGSFSISGKYYYADSEGRIYVNKWRKVSAGSYYYGSDASMRRSCRTLISGKYYYFQNNGKMAVKKWVKIKGKHYYFGTTGTMYTNTWVGNYYVNAAGERSAAPSKSAIKKASSKEVLSAKSRLIILGASRVREMAVAVQDAGIGQVRVGGVKSPTVFIAKPGATYSWASGTAVSELAKYLSLFPKSKVVLQFGNNDLLNTADGRISQYIRLYAGLIRKYPQAEFYIMDALPAKDAEKMNQKRVIFNTKLQEAFPAHYIGGYSYMEETGFTTSYNNMHYSAQTSRLIFKYILKQTGLN